MADRTTTAAPPDGSAIDTPTLESLADDLGEGYELIIGELVDLYLDEGARHVADLVGAAATGDSTTTRRVAHAFRSPSATLGATRLAALLMQIEEATAQPDLVELCRRAGAEYLLVTEGLSRYATTAGT